MEYKKIVEQVKKLGLDEMLEQDGIVRLQDMKRLKTDVAGIKSKFELAMDPELSYEERRRYAQQFYQSALVVAGIGPLDFGDELVLENAMIYLGMVYEL
jgi:hypothetical protein